MTKILLALVLFSAQAYCLPGGALKSPLLDQLSESSGLKAEIVTPEITEPADDRLADRYWITVEAPTAADRALLSKTGLAFENFDGNYVNGTIGTQSLQQVRRLGFKITYQATLSDFNLQFLKDFPQQDTRYHNYKETYDALKAIQARLPAQTSLFSLGKTAQGRDLWALRFNNTEKGAALSKKPGLALIGAHHAREHLSVEIPLAIAQWLADNIARPEVAKLMAERDVFVIPMVNADGAEYDIATGKYAWWRKNMNKVPGSSAVGVDLNRNYGWSWGGDSADPDSETYQGPKAFSEPETQVIKAFFDRYTNMKIMISYHSYGQLVLYPWGDADHLITDQKDLKAHQNIAAKMAGVMPGYRAMQSSDLYPATGDTCDWSYGAHKVLSFTIELDPGRYGYGGFYPGSAIVDGAAKVNISAAYYALQMAGNPYQ
ncbi:MAG: M14 family metallopeptidase [Elusimicrobiaceae bacterium]